MKTAIDTMPEHAALRDFHTRLQAWYVAHGRHSLPWRNTTDPYAIWVSEVMLQQTQVETVLNRFYQPFLERFPTLAALAEASEEEVLKHWQGLGYYSRARNLHRAARVCVINKILRSPLEGEPARQGLQGRRRAVGGAGRSDDSLYHPFPPPNREASSWILRSSTPPQGGSGNFVMLPNTVEQLIALPGIGRNTAHAVATFAYRQPVPVMEANVKRVLHRIHAREKATDNTLFVLAERLLDAENPFDYNQAMMDLGSMVCTPRTPKCGACPASVICEGKDAPERYPAPKAKKALPVRKLNILLLRDGAGRIYAEPRTTRFLNGMYRFVEVEREESETPESVIASVAKQSSMLKQGWIAASPSAPRNDDITHLGTLSHAYSHFALEAEVYRVQLAQKAKGNSWYTLEELERLPHARTEAKALKLLKIHFFKLEQQKIGVLELEMI